MRPRHIAAEYIDQVFAVMALAPASMRPRHIAAEYIGRTFDFYFADQASMRPRHIAAEYAQHRPDAAPGQGGFNEAAAYRRGIPDRLHKLSTMLSQLQ